MNAELDLTASEKIMMLLDGELPKSETGSLFYQIAQNDDLQDELHGHLKLKNLYIDKEPTPPEDLKRKLYAGIGLTSAGMIAGSSYIGQSTNYISTFFRHPLFITLASAISGAFITLFAVNQTNLGNFNSKSIDSPIVNSQIENKTNTVPLSTNEEITSKLEKRNNNLSNNQGQVPKQIYSKLIDNNGSEIQSSFNEFASLNINEIKVSKTNKTNDLVINKVEKLNENNNELNSKNIPTIVLEKPISSKDQIIVPNKLINKDKYKVDNTRFALTFRSFSAQNMSNFDVPANNPPAINNIAIGILYDSNENLSFGFEFGQENFLQEFKAINNQTEINLQQNRLAFWGGGVLTYKFSPVKNLAYMQPYGTIFLGGTNFGYITKQNLGLQYNISDKFAMVGGLEFTSLFSSYNNIWNNSHKYGATYGVILKF